MKTISTKFARLFVLAVCFGIATMSASVQAGASTFRYLKLDVTAQVGSLDPSIYEIQWMVDATSYPSAAVTDDNLILSNYPGTHSWTDKFNAFDKLTTGNSWSPFADDQVTVLPYFITIDLGAGNEIYPTAIGLTIAYKGRGLAAFTCQGSNDNTNWTNLLTVTGVVEDDWVTDATKSFPIDAPTITAISPVNTVTLANAYNRNGQIAVDLTALKGASSVSVIDTKGSVIKTIENAGAQLLTINVANKGLYLVQVKNGGKVSTSKVVL